MRAIRAVPTDIVPADDAVVAVEACATLALFARTSTVDVVRLVDALTAHALLAGAVAIRAGAHVGDLA